MTRIRPRRPTLVVIFFAMVSIVSLHVVLGQTPDPFIGTWRLNVQKSQFTPTAYASSVMKIEAIGDRRRTSIETELDSGATIRYEFTAGYDGKDYPLIFPTANAVMLRRIDARTIERTHKKDGKVDTVFVSTLSADGKVMTVTQKGRTPLGVAVSNLMVFERQ